MFSVERFSAHYPIIYEQFLTVSQYHHRKRAKEPYSRFDTQVEVM
jgi:hypothetical protein